ncbi:CoA transferase [Streptomyces hygroscopicus]|uniref:CaiB/BaiF CoA transferase family protein n=1 Tax=Streptomyces hygroscopicus TaxID=1912 RepID=UPI0007DB242E|nr:CoA transferase [Streptomyces sp. NBRC 109436]
MTSPHLTPPRPDGEPTGTGGPLHGTTVLDLTNFLSGPYCTQILADLGARVIKLEPPEGDSSRAIPPHFVAGDSAYYLGNNRSKESIAVDLKRPEGLEIAQDLIDRVDVVVENFRPGVCRRLGFDVEEIRRRRPELVWASISGFGQAGPWRDRPAYDLIVQALSGVMSLTGEPGRPSVRLGIPAGDLVAGMFAAIGVLAALADRARSGRGDQIDVAMLDCQLSMLSYQAVYSMIDGKAPQRQGSRHDSIPTYRSFVAGDGREFVVTANTERMWRELCAALELDGLVDDPRFDSAGSRLRNKEALWHLLESAFARRPAADWVARLAARRVPAALIKTVPEAIADAREAGREMVLDLGHDDGRKVSVIGNPVKFTDHQPAAPAFPPHLGENAHALLNGFLGYPAQRVRELQETGVLARPRQ